MEDAGGLAIFLNIIIFLLGYAVNYAILKAYKVLRVYENEEHKPLSCLGRSVLLLGLVVPYGMLLLVIIRLFIALLRYMLRVAREGMV